MSELLGVIIKKTDSISIFLRVEGCISCARFWINLPFDPASYGDYVPVGVSTAAFTVNS